MTKTINQFNVRVYALIINEYDEILLSDEYRMDRYMTKFPGGGLQFGEGTIDCIKRECREEFEQEVNVLSHYYTTDFFQQAYFYDNQQLISIYYKVAFVDPIAFKISDKPFDIQPVEEAQSFRWKKLHKLEENDLSLPVDRKVVELLHSNDHLNYF